MELTMSFNLRLLLEQACLIHRNQPDREVVERLQPFGRTVRLSDPYTADPRLLQAAVMLIVTPDSLLLTRRSHNLERFPGTLAFPGGRQEPGDSDPFATALRETAEEIGVDISRDQLLGRLPSTPRIVGRLPWPITPVVVHLETNPIVRPNPAEVAAVHRLQHGYWLGNYLDHASATTTGVSIQIGGKLISGITLFILELLRHSILEVVRARNRWLFPIPAMSCRGATVDSESFRNLDLGREIEIPLAPHVGAFFARRRFDQHEGVDLYCPVGTEVVAVEGGRIVGILPFTGEAANSPWWLETNAVLVEGESGIVVYGEIMPETKLGLNQRVETGQPIGRVIRVLRNEKGRPTSMLHLELRDRKLLSRPSLRGSWPFSTARDPSKYLFLSSVT